MASSMVVVLTDTSAETRSFFFKSSLSAMQQRHDGEFLPLADSGGGGT